PRLVCLHSNPPPLHRCQQSQGYRSFTHTASSPGHNQPGRILFHSTPSFSSSHHPSHAVTGDRETGPAIARSPPEWIPGLPHPPASVFANGVGPKRIYAATQGHT